MSITVLSIYDRISVFHSLKPFLFFSRRLFSYTASPEYCLKRDRNRVLFMDRWFLKPDLVDLELMRRLRDKYRTIFFFNGNAGGGIPGPEVLPYVDCFFNKSLFKDKSLYHRRLYGDELFSEHYHEKQGVSDPESRKRAVVGRDEDAAKLRVSWNIGIGNFPRHKNRQRAAVVVARSLGMQFVRPFYMNGGNLHEALPENSVKFDIQARWCGSKRPTLLRHREIMGLFWPVSLAQAMMRAVLRGCLNAYRAAAKAWETAAS